MENLNWLCSGEFSIEFKTLVQRYYSKCFHPHIPKEDFLGEIRDTVERSGIEYMTSIIEIFCLRKGVR